MIFLVVYGHVLILSDDVLSTYVANIIYAFHMPVFIFLSGYLTNVDVNTKKLSSWVMRILLIYAIAQSAQNILSYILGEGYVLGRVFLYEPYYALWYLISLVVWRVTIVAIAQCRVADKFLLLFSVVICAISGVIPIGLQFSFQRTLAFFPFFAIGYLCRKNNFMERIEQSPYVISIVVLIIGAMVACILPRYIPNSPYDSIRSALVRLGQTGNAFLMSFAVVRLSRMFAGGAKYGAYSLWIYIGHTFFLIIHRHYYSFINVQNVMINLLVGILLSLIYCAICVCLCYFSRETRTNRINRSI